MKYEYRYRKPVAHELKFDKQKGYIGVKCIFDN